MHQWILHQDTCGLGVGVKINSNPFSNNQVCSLSFLILIILGFLPFLFKFSSTYFVPDCCSSHMIYLTVMPEPGGPGGQWPSQYLANELTLLQPGEGRLSPPISTGTPKFFHLPASLNSKYIRIILSSSILKTYGLVSLFKMLQK